uniref:IpiB-like protein n=1 Tax=Phytophthora infestans TaxID=4787 RepID=Q2M432_PHYIN|nr:ipiB-like protein [Phytophthora infestans]
MFSNNKIFGLCIAVVALSSGAHAEKQVAETFGLLDASGVDNGVGVPGVASVEVGGPSYVGSGVRPILNRSHRIAPFCSVRSRRVKTFIQHITYILCSC